VVEGGESRGQPGDHIVSHMSEEQDLSVREKLLLMEAVTCGTHVIVTF